MDTDGWQAAWHRLRLSYPTYAALGRDLGYHRNQVQQVAKSLENATEPFKKDCLRLRRQLASEHVAAGEVAAMALQAIERIRTGEMEEGQIDAMKHRLQEKTEVLLDD